METNALAEGTPEALAAELTFRHSGWNTIRARVFKALNQTEQPFSRIENFRYCGTNAWIDVSDTDPPRFRVRSDRCHDRFCTPCGQERARVIAFNTKERVDLRNTRFITLTLRSQHEPLEELLDLLYSSFAKLRRTGLWQGTQTGGVAFLEIKWNAGANRWHPHLHILTEGRFIHHTPLSKAWKKATGGSFIVKVTKVNSLERVVWYVTKYASKPHDGSILRCTARLEEAIKALKGRRLCLTYGTWRGVCLTKVPDLGTWQPVARLTDLIRLARQGFGDAIKILDQIPSCALPDECKDPPDERPARSPPLRAD